MSLQSFYWYEEGRVLFVEASNASPNQVLLTDTLMNSLMDRLTHPTLHVIADWSEVRLTPDLRFLTQKITYPKHPKYGWTVVVGLPSPLAFMMSITNQFFRTPVKHVPSIQDAVNFLKAGGAGCQQLPYKPLAELPLLAIIHEERIEWVSR
jgi:hypothetical protein